jgi:signal peptidase I
MKKRWFFWGIVLAVIVGLYFIGRVTMAIQFYTVPSGANEPAIKPGDKIFASILKKPARLNLICYRAQSLFEGNATRVHRLCGLPGDLVEIRQGVLYVNGDDVDKTLNLKLPYTMALKDMAGKDFEDYEHTVINADSVLIVLETKEVAENKLQAVRKIAEPGEVVEDIQKAFSKNWNHDNFGPVRVPKDHYFVLGDNRNGSQDSRFLGFIPVKDFVGTVLWK